MTSQPPGSPRKLWMLYRVRPGGADPDAGRSTAAARRERVRACRTPEGAQRAAEEDRISRSDGASAPETLRWERWDGRLVSETRGGVAYAIERYDVLRN